jgi:DNA-binding NtrC family response regulator
VLSPLPGLRGLQTEMARKIAQLSLERWGERGATIILGQDRTMLETQRQLLQFAQADAPVLVGGETGSGKELFARALYLLGGRSRQRYLCINCAKYQDSQLLASELFGHKKGSFTGALADRAGIFEDADGGVVFLDEIAELSLSAQAMLLRTLSEGEVMRVGENRPRHADVRVIAATARDLPEMVKRGEFREDLYFRLRFLRLRIPPLRDRGDDWRLMLQYFLDRLNQRFGEHKHFSAAALALLAQYHWPGNVRELRAIVEVAFHSADGREIEPCSIAHELAVENAPARPVERPPSVAIESSDPFEQMILHGHSFWEAVHHPFIARDLNRREVRALVLRGLHLTQGSYKRLLPVFGIDEADYLKFMDFLRHHQLKPASAFREESNLGPERLVSESETRGQSPSDDSAGRLAGRRVRSVG